MLNSSCKTQGEFFMKNDNQKKNLISYLSGFAVGYFAIEIICWFFKALAGKK
jgi:hypothetical protein